jgi:ATP-dependent Clp protease ATP-binding subunit ClpA
MTANFGTERLRSAGVGFKPDGQSGVDAARVRDVIQQELKRQLLPEFLNRLDEIVVFQPLQPEHMGRIVELQLVRERANVVAKGYQLRWTPEVVALLAKDGYTAMEGARPVRTLIQQRIEDDITQQVLDGRLRAGQTIVVDVDNGAIRVRGEDSSEEEAEETKEEALVGV